jgi:peptide chain release factor 1
MLERLKVIYNQYEELRARLELPETYSDSALYARVEREARELQPVAEAYAAYVRACADMDAALELQSDPEMRELAQEEYQSARAEKERLERDLRVLLLPRDPNDQKNVIMEIRGGVGGEEGMLFAADLYRMYSLYAESRGWRIEVANVSETELGGIKEISFLIEGEGAWSRLKFEAGGHRVQRVPVTESGGRIHTSAATVAVLPEIEDVDFKLDLNDLKIDTYRSSGAGGQHVNKTESAIRITHLPTGVVVECQDERSQYKNKDRAMQILRSKLYEMEQAKQNAAVAAERKSQIGSGDRSERIRTYNFPQNRVTDHRLSGDNKNFNIDRIMNGDLDELIDALGSADQAAKLAENSEFGLRNSE